MDISSEATYTSSTAQNGRSVPSSVGQTLSRNALQSLAARQHSTIVAITIDVDGTNPAACAIPPVDPATLVGKSISDLQRMVLSERDLLATISRVGQQVIRTRLMVLFAEIAKRFDAGEPFNGFTGKKAMGAHLRSIGFDPGKLRVWKFNVTITYEAAKAIFDSEAPRGYPYVYLPEEKQVVRLHDDGEASQLFGKMRLRIKQRDTDLVRENLRAYIMEFGEQTRVEKLGCLRGGAIYVNNGRGGMFKITTESISEVANGTDGVLMHAPDLKPFPALDEAKLEEIRRKLGGIGAKVTDSLLCQHLNAHFEEGGSLSVLQYQQLVVLRFLSLFLGDYLDLRPIMIALGEQNSGKSTLWEKFMWLLYGTGYPPLWIEEL